MLRSVLGLPRGSACAATPSGGLAVLLMYISSVTLCPVDRRFDLNGITFVWRQQKAQSNQGKHGVSFERAAEAFFDPFAKLVDASTEEEPREALIGLDHRGVTLFVVHIEIQQDRIRIISARKATRQERKDYED